MSPPEAVLWRILRDRPNGLKFRRQRPADPYIFDFYCRAALLAIEIDGFAHDCGNNPRRDADRDEWAARKGIKTIRISGSDVKHNLEGIVTYILDECARRTPPPAVAGPPPQQLLGRIES